MKISEKLIGMPIWCIYWEPSNDSYVYRKGIIVNTLNDKIVWYDYNNNEIDPCKFTHVGYKETYFFTEKQAKERCEQLNHRKDVFDKKNNERFEYKFELKEFQEIIKTGVLEKYNIYYVLNNQETIKNISTKMDIINSYLENPVIDKGSYDSYDSSKLEFYVVVEGVIRKGITKLDENKLLGMKKIQLNGQDVIFIKKIRFYFYEYNRYISLSKIQNYYEIELIHDGEFKDEFVDNKGKYTHYGLRHVFDKEGYGYGLLHYAVTGDMCRDNKVGKLVDKARQALQELDDYLSKIDIDEKEN